MQIEVLTERIKNGKCSAILNYKTKRVVCATFDDEENPLSGGIPFDGASEMIHLWEAIKERLNMPVE